MKNLNILKVKRLGLFRKIKYCWQRITKGYCGYDLIDLNDYYAQIIVDSLIEFKDSGYMHENMRDKVDIIIDSLSKTTDIYYDNRNMNDVYKSRQANIEIALDALKKIWLKLWL